MAMFHQRAVRSKLITTMLVVGLSFGTSGCALFSSSSSQSQNSDVLTRTLPSSVTAEGVLLAAVLLKTGDIDEAVSQGIVTPDEVTEAKLAVDTGTLDLWRQRAEAEANA